jgi:hypothetical protein
MWGDVKLVTALNGAEEFKHAELTTWCGTDVSVIVYCVLCYLKCSAHNLQEPSDHCFIISFKILQVLIRMRIFLNCINSYEILGFHSSVSEDARFLVYDSVSFGECFWCMTLCHSVNVSGVWHCVIWWMFLVYDTVSFGECFWCMTLCHSVNVSGVW